MKETPADRRIARRRRGLEIVSFEGAVQLAHEEAKRPARDRRRQVYKRQGFLVIGITQAEFDAMKDDADTIPSLEWMLAPLPLRRWNYRRRCRSGGVSDRGQQFRREIWTSRVSQRIILGRDLLSMAPGHRRVRLLRCARSIGRHRR